MMKRECWGFIHRCLGINQRCSLSLTAFIYAHSARLGESICFKQTFCRSKAHPPNTSATQWLHCGGSIAVASSPLRRRHFLAPPARKMPSAPLRSQPSQFRHRSSAIAPLFVSNRPFVKSLNKRCSLSLTHCICSLRSLYKVFSICLRAGGRCLYL